VLKISEAEYAQRVATVREKLQEENCQALLAVSGYAERDGNVCYLCGHKNAFPYSGRSDVISGLGYSAFVVPVEGETTLISPLGYRPDVVTGVDRAKTGVNFAQDLVNAIAESQLGKAKLALAGGDIIPTLYFDELKRAHPEMTLEHADSLLVELRMIKSETELALMRRASKIADKAVRAAVESIKSGITESAIGTVARKVAMESGADYVVRDRVQSGSEIGRLRWPFASQKKVRKGELVSIDLVGWVGGYGFDILRMGCAGKPSKEQRRLIATAGEATQTMTRGLVDNGSIENSIAHLRDIEGNGFTAEPFGHGIGLEIVENPYLLPGSKGIVKRNMVFCVEPIVKLGRLQASIENEVIVTRSKPEVLTKLPVDLWR